MLVFDYGGKDQVAKFNNNTHYHNFMRMLFRADGSQKYTNEKTTKNFYWFVNDEEFSYFPETPAQRNEICRRPELVKDSNLMRVFCFRDIHPDKDGELNPSVESFVKSWKDSTVNDLRDSNFEPILFVFHFDVHPSKSLRFYAVCEGSQFE